MGFGCSGYLTKILMAVEVQSLNEDTNSYPMGISSTNLPICP